MGHRRQNRRFEGSPCHPARCPGLICGAPLGCPRACSAAPEGPTILAHGIAVGSFGQSEQPDLKPYYDAYGE